MTKFNISNQTSRAAIVAMIDAETDYDRETIRFHRDGTISAIKDANKTFNGPETIRQLVAFREDFDGGNPFRA